MSHFTVDKPNKWLSHMAEKYPDDAAGFNDVSDYIDGLRGKHTTAKNRLHSIINLAEDGLQTSDNLWPVAPSVSETPGVGDEDT